MENSSAPKEKTASENVTINVRRMIAEQNITQTSLADKLGMSQGNLSKILNGKMPSNWDIDKVVDLASILHVTVDELITSSQMQPFSYNEKPISRTTLNIQDICSMFAWLIREKYITFDPVVLTPKTNQNTKADVRIGHTEMIKMSPFFIYEKGYVEDQESGEYYAEDQANLYPVFYFSKYEPFSPCKTDEEREDLEVDLRSWGNDCEINIQVNKFLEMYLDLYRSYSRGIIKKKTLEELETILLRDMGYLEVPSRNF